jgi:Domain of unknown function (DUF5134)
MGMGAGHLLPDWLRIVWVVIYAAILLLHLRHAIGMSGQQRLWHSGHILMALGMVYMFLPNGVISLPIVVGVVIFALAAVAIAGWVVYALANRRPLDFLWVILLIDMLGMTYMFVAQQTAIGALLYLFAAYFAVEMGCWFFGAFNQPNPEQRVIPAVVGGGAVAVTAEARPLAEASTLEVRLTLGLMAAGMAYMFVAMLVGM